MKLEIKEKIIELDFNLKNFKEMLKEDLDLNKAVINNIKIIDNTMNVPQEDIKDTLYLAFDWGGFIKQINFINKDIIKFRFCNVTLEGFKQYKPLSTDLKDFEFEENEITDSVIILQDGIKHPNFAMDNLFCKLLFDYGDTAFKPKLTI